MSAHLCEDRHFLYLVGAALHAQYGVAWRTPGGERVELRAGDYDLAARVAQMLYEENVRSLRARYPDTTVSEWRGDSPAPEFTARDIPSLFYVGVNWVQVIKSCHCYEYQSCEHAEWEHSEAHAFISALMECAVHHVPGYEDAEWGAPSEKATARKGGAR